MKTVLLEVLIDDTIPSAVEAEDIYWKANALRGVETVYLLEYASGGRLRRLPRPGTDDLGEPDCTCDGGPQGEGLVSVPHDPSCPLATEEVR